MGLLVRTLGDVAVLEDDVGELFDEAGQFRAHLAWRTVVDELGDVFDCMCFWGDSESGVLPVSMGRNWITENHATKGIGRFNPRPWTRARLRSVQLYRSPPSNAEGYSARILLHELGHTWSSYVRAEGTSLFDEGTHWRDAYLGNRVANAVLGKWRVSCMHSTKGAYRTPEGQLHWKSLGQNSDGTFSWFSTPDERFGFDFVDLYLMGLLPANQVPPFLLLGELVKVDANRYEASHTRMTLAAIVADEGKRQPARESASLRQAFVVVTRNASKAEPFVRTVDVCRRDAETAFKRATTVADQPLGRLVTRLA